MTARKHKDEPESDAELPAAAPASRELSADGSLSAAGDPLTARVLEVGDRVGAFVEYWGFKAIHGRIWTLLALHRGPLHQSEITELLGVSKSLVSTAAAELVDYGLIRPVEERRNAPYEACMDIWPVVSDVLRSREWMLLESTRLSLEAALDEAELAHARAKQLAKEASADAPPPEPPRFDPKRMQLLLSMTESAQALLRMLIAIRVPKAVTGFAGWIARVSGLIGSLRKGD